MIGVGAGIVTQPFPNPDVRRRFEAMSYFFCLQTVVGTVLHSWRDSAPEDTIEFVFDERRDLAFKASQLFTDAVAAEREGFRGSIRELQFGQSTRLAPLQAADLLAYETFKEITNREAENDVPVRLALHNLVAGRSHVAQYSSYQATTSIIYGAAAEKAGDKITEVAAEIAYPGISTVYCSGAAEPIRPELRNRRFRNQPSRR
jgi:hypothetical protein